MTTDARPASGPRSVPWLAPLDRRDCVCGGIITVIGPTTDRKITNAVQGHQAGDRHQSWIQMGGIEAMGGRFPGARRQRGRR